MISQTNYILSEDQGTRNNLTDRSVTKCCEIPIPIEARIRKEGVETIVLCADRGLQRGGLVLHPSGFGRASNPVVSHHKPQLLQSQHFHRETGRTPPTYSLFKLQPQFTVVCMRLFNTEHYNVREVGDSRSFPVSQFSLGNLDR